MRLELLQLQVQFRLEITAIPILEDPVTAATSGVKTTEEIIVEITTDTITTEVTTVVTKIASRETFPTLRAIRR